MIETTYSYTKQSFLKRYPTSFVYVDEVDNKTIKYKTKEILQFFRDLKDFLDMNKEFFERFGRIMTHKIKVINPENKCKIVKEGFEYVGDTINVYTTKGVFQITFDIDHKLK